MASISIHTMSELESLSSSLSELSLHTAIPLCPYPRPLHESPGLASKDEGVENHEDPHKLSTETRVESGSLSIENSISDPKKGLSLACTPTVVPRRERRGLFSWATLISEYHDPRSYPDLQKLVIVLIAILASVAGPMGATILLPAETDLTHDLQTSMALINTSMGVYSLSLGVFPLWWSNFSETHGRRSVHIVSFSWFLAFSVGSALAPNTSTLIALRLLAGAGASATQSCGAGIISDLYTQEERGKPLSLFYLGPLLSPLLSPVLGGALAEAWGWRAIMWFMVMLCGASLLMIVLVLPETLPRNNSDVIKKMIHETFEKDETLVGHDLERIVTNVSHNASLRRQMLDEETPVDMAVPSLLRLNAHESAYTRRVKTRELVELEAFREQEETSWCMHIYDYTVRPLHAMVFMAYPPFLIAVMYSSISFMAISFSNISISNEYSLPPYNFSPILVGLMYIPNSVTFVLTSVFGGKWNNWLVKRHKKQNDREMRPEDRLSWNIVVAAVLFPPASVIFGWSLDKKIHWAVPLVGSALLGISVMLVMSSTLAYVVDLVPGKGATGVALNNLVRQTLAATATFVTKPIVHAVGIGVLFCVYAGVVSLTALSVLYLKKRGSYFREKHDITSYYAKL